MNRMRRHLGSATLKGVFVLVTLALILLAQTSRAETVYTWTDEEGVVHFSDVPPEGIPDVTERSLQPPPPLQTGGGVSVSTEEESTESGEDKGKKSDTSATGDEGRPSKQVEGPARLIITSQQVLPRGPRTRHILAAVKNVGGETASGVGMTLRYMAQGNPCDQDEVDVTPQTLEPGETGHVDAALDNPCFLDETSVDFEPHWQ